MYFIEYVLCHRLEGGEVDPNDLAWDRYPRAFASEAQADNEAGWLSDWDDQYVYRVVEVPEC